MFRRLPVERSHGEVVILALSDSKLFFKVRKAIELVTGIEFLVVFSVAAFYLAVMSGRVRLNQFVPDTELLQGHFKQSWFWILAVSQTVGELGSILRK